MIRLFKHYIPHAVLLLGLFDLLLLVAAGELAWKLRASQIGIEAGAFGDRFPVLFGAGAIVLTAMIAVGVYGADSLRSMRYAAARLLVAVSLGIIALTFIDFLIPGQAFWRSTLAYAMGLSVVLLMLNRLIIGGILGASAFRRRVLVLGSGRRAQRLRELSLRPESGFVIVGYLAMSDAAKVVEEAIQRDAIHDLNRFVENLGASEVVLALEERRNALPLKDLLRIKTAGRPCERFLELPRTRDRAGRSRHAQSLVADLLRRLLLGPRGFERCQAPVRRARQRASARADLPGDHPVRAAGEARQQGPAFFRQTRVGLFGQPFELIKLRSMRDRRGARRRASGR